MNVHGFLSLVRLGMRGRRLIGTVLFVVVVAVAAAGVVSGIESRRSAARLWDDAFDRAGAPHVTLSASTPDVLERAVEDDAVSAFSEPVVAMGETQLVAADRRVDLVLRAARADTLPAVGAPWVVTGRLAADGTELSLERSLALDLGVGVGDQVLIDHGGTIAEFRVVGTVLDFVDCFYPQCDPGVVWIDPAGLDRLGTADRFRQVFARLADPATAPTWAAEVASRYGDQLADPQDWLDTRSDALATNQFFGAFLSGFGLFVLLAAGVVVAGSVTNRVAARRRDIALLKSVGVTPTQVVTAITVEHVLLGVLGTVIGAAAAVALAPRLRIGVTTVLTNEGTLSVASSLTALVAMLVTIIVATVLPAWRVGRLTAAAALRPPASGTGRSRLARLAAAAGAGPVALAGLKETFGRPLRSALVLVSVILAMAAVLITLGFDRTVSRATSRPALVGDPWDVTVTPAEGADLASIDRRLAATEGVARWFTETEARQLVDGEVVLVRAVGGEPAAAAYVVHEGRPLRNADEAIAGYGLLQRLGKRVGDKVQVDVDQAHLELTIVGRYGEMEDSGEVLQIRWEALSAAVPTARPGVFRVVAGPDVQRQELGARLHEALGPLANVQPRDSDTEALDAFGTAFWAVAGLVVVVAVVNLAATMLLGARERSQELGVLRAIGFTPGQVVASVAVTAGALAVVAIIIGWPLGWRLGAALLSVVGRAAGAGPELGASASFWTGLLAVAAVATAATVVGTLVCVATGRRSVSELIRYE